jgi:hypothetical protein
MNLNKADIERIVESVLERLELKVDGEPYWTDDRTVRLMLGDREITRINFSVKSGRDDSIDY